MVVVVVVVSLVLTIADEVSSVVFGCWAADVVDDGILCFRRFDAPVAPDEIRTTLSFRLLPPLCSPVLLLVSSP